MTYLHRIRLRTPENVFLDIELAGIGNRALALAIDYTILAVVLGMGAIGFLLLVSNAAEPHRNWLIALALLAGFALYGGYFVLFETLWRGQTPGKRFVHIRVLLEDGRPIGLTQAGLRALLRPLDDLLYLGALCILFSNYEKRIGDWVAGTLVVQEAPSAPTVAVSSQAEALATQLTGRPELARLSPDDYAVVQRFLQARHGMDPEARLQLARRLTEQLDECLWFSDPSLQEDERSQSLLLALRQVPQRTDGAERFLEALWLACRERQQLLLR